MSELAYTDRGTEERLKGLLELGAKRITVPIGEIDVAKAFEHFDACKLWTVTFQDIVVL